MPNDINEMRQYGSTCPQEEHVEGEQLLVGEKNRANERAQTIDNAAKEGVEEEGEGNDDVQEVEGNSPPPNPTKDLFTPPS